ncbi:helix-turn-helix domain-containing protein [Carboxylicivirga sp. N1Y90]|uniref:helix-turn-helix domain-containing protein n=1 Tax=Carboxylicivirga fragile TaxID=3417571 RepID=UPI003D331158|nr:helix-turn-helix transcriptional regulator [Marinilabiliaceae bacterium N1Y90]
MSFFGKNIRKIRSIRKISQTEFANIFDLSRASVGSYEEGRAEPKLELINNVAKHFSITIDELINKELTVNDLYHFDVGNEPVFKSPVKQKLEIRKIPYSHSSELIKKSIKQLLGSTSLLHIPIPPHSQDNIAISIDKVHFKTSPEIFENNTSIIICTDTNTINTQQYYLIKTKNAIYISKLNILANERLHLTEIDSELHIINKNEIEYCYPIIQYIGTTPSISNDEKLLKLEKQIQQLIQRTL